MVFLLLLSFFHLTLNLSISHRHLTFNLIGFLYWKKKKKKEIIHIHRSLIIKFFFSFLFYFSVLFWNLIFSKIKKHFWKDFLQLNCLPDKSNWLIHWWIGFEFTFGTIVVGTIWNFFFACEIKNNCQHLYLENIQNINHSVQFISKTSLNVLRMIICSTRFVNIC